MKSTPARYCGQCPNGGIEVGSSWPAKPGGMVARISPYYRLAVAGGRAIAEGVLRRRSGELRLAPIRLAPAVANLSGGKEKAMPRLAANLGYLFADRLLLARFGAAAASGFSAVELQFPYEQPAAAVRREIERHQLKILGINTPLGPAGEAGLAGVPGRERDFHALFRRSLDYAVAIGATAIHCMAGQVPPQQQAEGEKVFA